MTDKLSAERDWGDEIMALTHSDLEDGVHEHLADAVQAEFVAIRKRVERQADHITQTDGSIGNRNEKVRKWKRLHNKVGKKYAALKQRVEGIDEALKEIADLVDPDDPHDLGGPHISIPWILDRFAATEEEKDDQLSESAS